MEHYNLIDIIGSRFTRVLATGLAVATIYSYSGTAYAGGKKHNKRDTTVDEVVELPLEPLENLPLVEPSTPVDSTFQLDEELQLYMPPLEAPRDAKTLEEKTLEQSLKMEVPEKDDPWYTNPWVWVTVGAAITLGVVGGVAYGVSQNSNRKHDPPITVRTDPWDNRGRGNP